VKGINRILSSVLLLGAGIALNFLTGSFIITTVVCCLLGLVVNSGGMLRRQPSALKTMPPQPTTRHLQTLPRSVQPTTGIQCASCGATVKRDSKYCNRCGSEMAQSTQPETGAARTYRPEQVTAGLESIRNQDQEKYAACVLELLMVDERGKYWSIGVNSSKWYVREGEDWVASEPAGTMRIVRRSNIIPESVQAPKPAPAIARKPVGRICNFCGVENEPSSAYCINCGHQVSAPIRPVAPPPAIIRTCERCGATVNPRKRFCTKCGNPLPAS
jgi:uncharacterized OB-fold protein